MDMSFSPNISHREMGRGLKRAPLGLELLGLSRSNVTLFWKLCRRGGGKTRGAEAESHFFLRAMKMLSFLALTILKVPCLAF